MHFPGLLLLELSSTCDRLKVMLMPDVAGKQCPKCLQGVCVVGYLKSIFHNWQKQSPASELGLSVPSPLSPVLLAVSFLALQ